MNKTHTVFASLLLLSMVFFSCDRKADATLEYSVSDMEIVLEGPLFKGSNEAQVKVPFSPETVLGPAGYERKNIKNIAVKSVSLSIKQPENFNLFQSSLIQIVGGQSPLTPVAVISPVPENVSRLQPDVSPNASFPGLKEADSFYFVIDANLKDDFEDNMKMTGNISFTIEVNK